MPIISSHHWGHDRVCNLHHEENTLPCPMCMAEQEDSIFVLLGEDELALAENLPPADFKKTVFEAHLGDADWLVSRIVSEDDDFDDDDCIIEDDFVPEDEEEEEEDE